MSQSLVFDPLVAWPLIWALAGLAVVLVAVALWRGLPGWALRGVALALVIAALAGPVLQVEQQAPLSDIVILVVDESASQKLGDRPDQTARAVARIEAEVAALPDTELRVVTVGDGPDNAGTLAMTALAEAMAAEPRARLAGAILVTDGQVHDMALTPDLPAPLHVLLTGRSSDWDRRLTIKDAPAFGNAPPPSALRSPS